MRDPIGIQFEATSPSPRHVKVMTDDGTELKVSSATIYMDAMERTRCDVTVVLASADISASVGNVTLECPLCKDHFEHECPRDEVPPTLGQY